MSTRRKPSNVKHLRLRRRLAGIVEINRQINIQLNRTLKNMKHAEQIIEKTARKIK